MVQIVDDHPNLVLIPESQHLPGQSSLQNTKYKLSFEQIYISRCVHTEVYTIKNALCAGVR